MSKFKFSENLREDILYFLQNNNNYLKCIAILGDKEKDNFTAEESNMIITLLGHCRLGEVFYLVERFGTEVIEIKENDIPDMEQGK